MVFKNNKLSIAKKNILRESEEIGGKTIRGYDFSKGLDWEKVIDSYETTGIQATNFSKAIEIIRKMQNEGAFIYLGYTSNLVTSGLRDVFRYLVQNKKVDVLVTTAGGIEEDIIKCLGDFYVGDFKAKGRELRDKGANRAGNIFIPNSRYCKFEEFIMPILEEIYEKQEKMGKIITVRELIWKLGEKINDERSIYYHCWRHKIPVFCPALTDGSLGDMIYFFKSRHPDFKIDITEDIVEINNSTIGKRKTGVILLGAGIMKHHICNANMFRNGTDYAVYINTKEEFDGSDSGALPDEAISWGKIGKNAETVKIYADATLVFPLIVGKTFAEENK